MYLALTIYTNSLYTHWWLFAKMHENADAASEIALQTQYTISRKNKK